jgi:hypothetical protein
VTVARPPTPAPPDDKPAEPANAHRPVAGLGLLVGTAVILRLPAFFASRHLVFDDGVYGASAVALRAGGLPFRDVFSSQGPLFLPLVWAADQAGLHTLNGPRLLALASTVVLVVAIWWAARALGLSTPASLVASALVATSGSILWVTAPITSDGPALGLATLAVALALRYRRSPSSRLAIGVGLAVGAALSVKSLLVAAAAPVGLILLLATTGTTRRRHFLAAVGSSVLVAVITALPWGVARVWDQSVTYHLEAAGSRTPIANARKVISTLFDRDLPLAMAAMAAIVAAVWLARRRGSGAPGVGSGVWLAGVWLAATVAVLLFEHPLWRSHNAHLVPAAALLIATTFDRLRAVGPPWRPAVLGLAGAAAAGLLVPYHTAHMDEILWPERPRGIEAAARAAIRALPPGAWAISDEPGLVWRAGRRTPDDLVDTSILRIESERITAESLAAAAADRRVCAVLVWSPRFGDFAALPALLEAEGYAAAAHYGGPRVFYGREACDPPS